MINGNYFGNKGLLVSWSLFRAPKEKAESQGMLSPGRTCNIRGGKSWIGKWCWACILKWIIIISHGLIWRAFPDGSGGGLSLTPWDVGVALVAAVRVGVLGALLWAPGDSQPCPSRLSPHSLSAGSLNPEWSCVSSLVCSFKLNLKFVLTLLCARNCPSECCPGLKARNPLNYSNYKMFLIFCLWWFLTSSWLKFQVISCSHI